MIEFRKPKKPSVFNSPEIEARYNAAYATALKLWQVPYEEFYIPTQFGDTHVIASGPREAAPLVTFHPAGCGALIWCRNVGAFSQHYRTYAVDVLGEVNKSIPTRRMNNRQELADWIGELFDGLGFKSAHLVGNSFGGFAVLNMVLLLPERVKKAVLISPAATFAQIWPWWWYFFPAYGIGSNRLKRRAFRWIWQGFPVDEPIARLRETAVLCGTPNHTPPVVFRDEELRQIQTHVLLLIGDHEVIYDPARVIRRASRLLPHLKSEIVPNANHNAQYTAAEFVNSKIIEFLGEFHISEVVKTSDISELVHIKKG
jgi:pimeloyl-ACP methyl ester carboxylesterase